MKPLMPFPLPYPLQNMRLSNKIMGMPGDPFRAFSRGYRPGIETAPQESIACP